MFLWYVRGTCASYGLPMMRRSLSLIYKAEMKTTSWLGGSCTPFKHLYNFETKTNIIKLKRQYWIRPLSLPSPSAFVSSTLFSYQSINEWQRTLESKKVWDTKGERPQFLSCFGARAATQSNKFRLPHCLCIVVRQSEPKNYCLVTLGRLKKKLHQLFIICRGEGRKAWTAALPVLQEVSHPRIIPWWHIHQLWSITEVWNHKNVVVYIGILKFKSIEGASRSMAFWYLVLIARKLIN